MARRRRRNRNQAQKSVPISGNIYRIIQSGQNIISDFSEINSGEPIFGGIVGFPSQTDEEMVKRYMEAFTIAKAENVPQVQSGLSTLNLLPEPMQDNIAPYPDYGVDYLKSLASEHLAVKMIINVRTNDILSFSTPSQQPWKRGWKIIMRNAALQPTDEDLRDIQAAQMFLEMGGIEYGRDVFKRDLYGSYSFPNFLSGLIRDTYTYDAMSIFTFRDQQKRVRQFSLFPAEQIRLALLTYSTVQDGKVIEHLGGYKNDPSRFAVALTETGQPGRSFTREELYYYRRNVRNQPRNPGYGYSEVAQALDLIQTVTHAVETNKNVFDRNSIPLSYLKMKGGWTNKQFAFVQRYFQNVVRNRQFAYSIPAFKIPKDGDIELGQVSNEIRKAAYTELWNMTLAAFSVVCGIPHTRLGYSMSGEVRQPKENPAHEEQNRDYGLIVLLSHIETVINEALIQQRWPRLMFAFTSKNPDEDARAYEARYNSMFYGERRAANDLQPYSSAVFDALTRFDESLQKLSPEVRNDPELMRLARASVILEVMPADPALAGVAQTILSQVMGGEAAPGGDQAEAPVGARISNKKDPVRSREHGHQPGVRRDSRKEKDRAEPSK